MASWQNALVAIDTNVPLDLAGDKEDVLDAIGIIRKRLTGGRLLVTPTAFQELVFLADHSDTAEERKLATKALKNLANWGFELVNLVPIGHGIVERIADRLVDAQLLPVDEYNDALILAEAALLGCAMLLTSDEHLRGMDYSQAALELRTSDVSAPIIATPREIVRKFF